MSEYVEDSTSLQFLTIPADDSIIPACKLNNKQDRVKGSVKQFLIRNNLTFIYNK